MADALDEKGVAALLAMTMAPVAVHWGHAPFESSSEPPSLPLVVLQRLSYTTAGYEDQCEGEYMGDALLGITVWALGYEDARTVTTDVRNAMEAATGWRLQQEVDTFSPDFHAWSISGQWLAAGIPPT